MSSKHARGVDDSLPQSPENLFRESIDVSPVYDYSSHYGEEANGELSPKSSSAHNPSPKASNAFKFGSTIIQSPIQARQHMSNRMFSGNGQAGSKAHTKTPSKNILDNIGIDLEAEDILYSGFS